MQAQTWKIGELAQRTHVSVRTLHYYDEIGLLRPSARTEAGHRLYTADDVTRLQGVMSLRQLGLSLEDIRACLDSPDFALAPVLDLHMARLTEQIARQQHLLRRLQTLRSHLSDGKAIPATQFLKTMEAIMTIDKYLTPEQLQSLASRRDQHGEAMQQGFKSFLTALRTHLEAGDDPASDAVQTLAKGWIATGQRFMADGDPAIASGLRNMVMQEPDVRKGLGLDDTLMTYLGKVMAVARH